MFIYNELMKHEGFKDNRTDSRYVVKFHDIFYYMPDEYEKEHEAEIDNLFEDFCGWQAEGVEDYAIENNIDIDNMLTRMCCGHYRAFIVDIPEITNDNAIELAMEIYDEVGYEGNYYVDNYIKITNYLQDMEDNYMEYWFDFIEGNEYMPQEIISEMKDAYKKDMERRQAAITMAK